MAILISPPPQRPAIAYVMDGQQLAEPQGALGKAFDKQNKAARAGLLTNRLDPFVLTISSIVEVGTEIYEDEDDFVAPTHGAIETTLLLLYSARARMKATPFPRGLSSATGTGGIRIEWQRQRNSVRLVVPGKRDGLTYIYYEFPEGYNRTTTVTAQTLAELLERLA